VVGGLEDPHLNCTLYLYNEPSTVTVSQYPIPMPLRRVCRAVHA
jgi:hypothetical protein